MKLLYVRLTQEQSQRLQGILSQLIEEMEEDQDPDIEEIVKITEIMEAVTQPAQTPEGMAHEIHRLRNLVQGLQLEKASKE